MRPNMPGCRTPSGLSKRARSPHRAGRLVEPVFGEIELALECRLLAVGEAHRRHRARRRPPAWCRRASGRRAHRRNRRAHRCRSRNRSGRSRRSWSAASGRAGRDCRPRPAGGRCGRERRLDLGEFEVEAGMCAAPPPRPDAGPGRPGYSRRRSSSVETERLPVLASCFGALELRLGEFEQARRHVDLRLRLHRRPPGRAAGRW